jgi:hypothetical protein
LKLTTRNLRNPKKQSPRIQTTSKQDFPLVSSLFHIFSYSTFYQFLIMAIDFSSQSSAGADIEQKVKDFEELNEDSVDLDEENILEELYIASLVLKDKFSWTKNLSITNKIEELQRFKESWENDETYQPSFNFSDFEYFEENCIKLLDLLIDECQKIDRKTVKEYNFQELTVEDLRNLYRGIFEELKLYVQVSANLDDRQEWKKNCLKIWPMNDRAVMKSKRRLSRLDVDNRESEKNLQADDLKSMWENELSRMGVDYDIQIRDVDGCFNIPEEQRVIVARGSEEERFYSREEAKMLTMHELFHVTRGYNGMKLGQENGFPPILGVHTPFYDATEEGGAVYREFETDVITPRKEKDYYLRALAAFYTYQDHKFSDIVQKLVENGARLRRAFALAARNREILRHHIYIGGYYQDWESNTDRRHLVNAKVNRDWARKIQRELQAEGSGFSQPPVTAEQLFDYQL